MENEFTRQNLKTIVVRTDFFATSPKDFLHPSKKLCDEIGLNVESEVWQALIVVQTGFDKTEDVFSFHQTEAKAREWVTAFCSLLQTKDFMSSHRQKLWSSEHFDQEELELRYSVRGDGYFFAYLDIQIGAGLIERTSQGTELSKDVKEWLGEEQISWLKNTFGDHWREAACLQYCENHYPITSLAYLASQLAFNLWIADNEYSVGYLWREIEAIRGGSTELASKSLTTHARAGQAGGQSSQKLRLLRMENFMKEIEKLGDLFPRVEEDYLVEKAFSNASQKYENFWKDGSGQAEKYSSYLRSEQPFKARYEAIFKKIA